jgi:hypothetical protein
VIACIRHPADQAIAARGAVPLFLAEGQVR